MAYYCPECGNELVLEDDGDYYCDNCMCYYDPSIAKQYTDPSECGTEPRADGEQGCKACGNPSYPECKASCPLFDN